MNVQTFVVQIRNASIQWEAIRVNVSQDIPAMLIFQLVVLVSFFVFFIASFCVFYETSTIYFVMINVVDINECKHRIDACGENAICVNNVGSFECVCKEGYGGNPGEHCYGKCLGQ